MNRTPERVLALLLSISGMACGEDPFCGDGALDAGEACDDGNAANADGCEADCSLPACGNGINDPGELCFGEPQSISITDPVAITVEDINTDGVVDLVVTTAPDNALSLLEGAGDGSFTLRANVPVQTLSPAVVADFNQDDRPDFATIRGGGLDVLLSSGDFTFGAPTTFAVGTEPAALIAEDLNGDLVTDVVAANALDDTLSLLLCNGDGTFVDQRLLQTGQLPSAIVAEDFNRDSLLDLAVLNSNDNTVGVILRSGIVAQFQLQAVFPVGVLPINLVVGDLNQDNNPDLAVINRGNESSIGVLLNNGDGTFQPQQTFPIGSAPKSLSLGDFDGDSILDAAVLTEDVIELFLGKGDGSFAPSVTLSAVSASSILAVSDLNQDGLIDFLIADFISDTLLVTLHQPN